MSHVHAAAPFEPTWTSLRRHRTPDWLADAKFGIYCHWGLSSVKYQPGNEALSDDEALSRWTAERFDADAWADLFVRAGARFGGPVAWHGSPLLHWDSALSPHNTARRGPGRDILDELERAVRARGLKFMASFHAIGDEGWVELAQEAVDRYRPDLLWVDASFGGTKQAHHLKLVDHSRYTGGAASAGTPNPGAHPDNVLEQLSEANQKRFLAHLFNDAAARGGEVAFVYKSFDLPPGIGTRDLENGLLDHIAYDPWVTDLDMNLVPDWPVHGWFWREGVPLRSAANLVHVLMDTVSKNGTLLLNVPPYADGSFPDAVHQRLNAVGDWLERNGAAVYGACPWYVYGEGPTVVETGNYAFHHNDHFGRLAFTPDDVRYTCNGTDLYATVLGRPAGPVTLGALSTGFKGKAGSIAGVALLGSDAPLTWTHDARGVVIDPPPADAWCDLANVFHVTWAG